MTITELNTSRTTASIAKRIRRAGCLRSIALAPFVIIPLRLAAGLDDRLNMRRRYRLFAEYDMTFCALKGRVRLARLHLEIHHAAIINGRRDVTQTARRDGDTFRFSVKRVDRFDVVTGVAAQLVMSLEFMPERSRRVPLPPRVEYNSFCYADLRREFCIEVRNRRRQFYLVTSRAIRRCGSDPRILRVTSETSRVTGRNSFESSLLQPKTFAQSCGWFC